MLVAAFPFLRQMINFPTCRKTIPKGIFMHKHFHSLIVAWIGAAVLLTAGCDREPQQRQTFIDFLKKEAETPRKNALEIPTPAMRKRYGNYAPYYDVIIDFNKTISTDISKPINRLYRECRAVLNKPDSSVTERREAITKLRDALQKIEKSLDSELAIAEAKAAVLSQPNNMKIVYFQVFDKYVRHPARELKATLAPTDELLGKYLAMLDFFDAHKGKITIQDGMIQINDPKLTAQLNAIQAEITQMEQTIQAKHTEFTR
jgi:hypothetical protein